MRRQMLTIVLGVVLSFISIPVSGYLVYKLSDTLSFHLLPLLTRYILDPVIALLVGACVGALAKSHAGVLSALSLAPWAFLLPWAGRKDSAHLMMFVLLSFLYLFFGMVAATATFRMRARSARNDPIRT